METPLKATENVWISPNRPSNNPVQGSGLEHCLYLLSL